jgi:hypothetical protein
MDVINFLYLSLGNNKMHLHDSICSRRACASTEAGFNDQDGDRVRGVFYRRTPFSCVCVCVFFLREKVFNAKDIHKEIFPVHCGKYLRRKAVHNWVAKFSEGRLEVADDVRPGAGVAETTVKILLRFGPRRTGKAMRQAYQSQWRICREINVLSPFEYHMF